MPSSKRRKSTAREPKRPTAAPGPQRSATERSSKRPKPRLGELAARAGRAARRGAGAAVALASGPRLAPVREALRAAGRLYMRVAERAGQLVLAAWLVIWPGLLALLRLARRGLVLARRALALARPLLRWAERELTPRRVTLATTALVAVLLGASQFADYTTTRIGADAYAGVEDIAPAPEMGTASAGSAHAWLGLPIAAAALLAVAACARGRRLGAVALAALGLATLAISLLIDLPKGLDEGGAAVAYEGAKATLESGFWVQLVCGALLVALAPLLLAHARGARAGRRERRDGTRRASAGALLAAVSRSNPRSRGRDAPEPAGRAGRGRRRAGARERNPGSDGEAAPGEPLPEG